MDRQTVSGWWTEEAWAWENQVWNWVKGEGWSWERVRVPLVYWSAWGWLFFPPGATEMKIYVSKLEEEWEWE